MAEEFAGKLRERIRIERSSNVRDALGSSSSQIELVGEYWATVEAVGNASEAISESRAAMPRWRVTLRQTDSILPGDRLVWSGRNMVVRTVSEDRRLLPKTILDAEEKR